MPWHNKVLRNIEIFDFVIFRDGSYYSLFTGLDKSRIVSNKAERMISMFEKLKKFCDSFLELGVPGFDLAVYKDGECVLRYMGWL